jgi:phenylpropionate dioxygenase-like ring-hydroxylating dioxygenase large terminal subunit
VPVTHYLDRERFDREMAAFARCPRILLHSSELAAPGMCISHDGLGLPILLVRGPDGKVRAFLNVCRHRGNRLVDAPTGCASKAVVCPYHGWTYDLTGALIHVPHREGFPSLRSGESGLSPFRVEERCGFVWGAAPAAGELEVDRFIDPVAEELEWFGFARQVQFKKSERTVAANWKLLVETFLEGYHLKHLHRDSGYRFFLDNCGAFERAGPHARMAAARRSLLEPSGEQQVVDLVTPTYHLFPASFVIAVGDTLMQWSFHPVAPDQTIWDFRMLLPPDADPGDPIHDKTFDFHEQTLFGAEDLATAERIQRGLASGANHSLRFGTFELPVSWFHGALEELLVSGAGGAAG